MHHDIWVWLGKNPFLGILVDGFPNSLMVMGPHAGPGNFPRAAEIQRRLGDRAGPLSAARARPRRVGRPPRPLRQDWTDHVLATSEGRHLLFAKVDSWMTGI